MVSRIHRVELHNFKSYAGDVTIGPFRDFTCIVGPNGAGKSNLMDALSFVLSTTSTSALRGKSASDFINRSAAKECAVSIVMVKKGSETETTFTRRMDAEGNTATLIDHKRVSARQFAAGLEAHHVGARVNVFLVFQHEVETVAQKRARELTALLEQVSGSGELRQDYAAKKTALEVANEALSSASVEKRGAAAAVTQMRLVKKEAEKFEETRRRYMEAKRDVALTELFHVETELERQKTELDVFNERLAELQRSIASEEAIRKMKRSYADLHKSYLEELKRNRKSADDLRSRYNTMDRIKAALAHLNRKRESQKIELDGLNTAAELRNRESKRLKEEQEKQVALLEAFDKQCEAEDAESAATNKVLGGEHLVEYRRLRKEADCETVKLRQEMATVRRQQESVQEAVRQSEHAKGGQALQRTDLTQAIQRAEAHGGELQRRRKDLEEAAATLEQQITGAEKDLAQMQRRNTEREGELARIEEQLYELRYMKDTDRQNSRASEALQTLRSLFPLRGRLVDLCSIPNDRYRNAVTVALGKNIDAIVVDTTEVAIACVRYMKQQRMPPMTFLPLDSVQGVPVDDRVRTFGGTCKPIVDVVRYEPEIEPAVRYALGQTLVCDAIAEAKSVAYGRANGERFKVVTLDGTMLLKNGSVQGGLASVQSRARKWDEKKHEDLRVAREQLLSDAASGGSETALARAHIAIRDMTARRDFTRSRLQVVSTEMSASEAKLKALQEELKKHAEAEHALAERASRYNSEEEALHKQLLALSKSISLIEGRIFADFQKRVNMPNLLHWEAEQAQRQKGRDERRQQLRLLIHKLGTSIEMTGQREGGGQALEDAQEVFGRLTTELDQCEKDLVSYKSVIGSAEKKHEGIKASVTAAREKLDVMEKQIREATRHSEAEINRLAHARKGATGLQAACDTLRLRRLNIVRRCQMDQTDIPLKPASATGTKRGRGEETPRPQRQRGGTNGDADAEPSLNLSESFCLISEEGQERSTGSSSPTHTAVAARKDSVCVDFSTLSDALRHAGAERVRFQSYKQRTDAVVEGLAAEMEGLAPNLKAASRYVATEDRLGASSTVLDEAREQARKAHAEFLQVKELRTSRFMEAFEKIAESVGRIYQELTLGTRAHAVHGSAYLSLEDVEEPYLGGTTYHATPPMKRFMPMELLSGGERTMAALALLFAIHAVSPAPFFILDEVDAALDADNVAKLAVYLRNNCRTCQFIVVSLKDQLYHMADLLVGVMKDKEKTSSRVLTMDLRGYQY